MNYLKIKINDYTSNGIEDLIQNHFVKENPEIWDNLTKEEALNILLYQDNISKNNLKILANHQDVEVRKELAKREKLIMVNTKN